MADVNHSEPELHTLVRQKRFGNLCCDAFIYWIRDNMNVMEELSKYGLHDEFEKDKERLRQEKIKEMNYNQDFRGLDNDESDSRETSVFSEYD